MRRAGQIIGLFAAYLICLAQSAEPDLHLFHEAEKLRDVGTAQTKQEAAEKFLEAAKALHTEGYPKHEADALADAGAIYLSLSDYRKAMALFEQSLAVIRSLPERGAADRKSESDVLNNMGTTFIFSGEYRKALDRLHQALELCRLGSDRAQEASILNNIATAYCYLSDYDKGLEVYNQALPLHHAAGTVAKSLEATAASKLQDAANLVPDPGATLNGTEGVGALVQQSQAASNLASTLKTGGQVLDAAGKLLDVAKEGIKLNAAINAAQAEQEMLSNATNAGEAGALRALRKLYLQGKLSGAQYLTRVKMIHAATAEQQDAALSGMVFDELTASAVFVENSLAGLAGKAGKAAKLGFEQLGSFVFGTPAPK